MRNGFTTIRNLGDPASVTYDLRDAINAGVIEGPRIIGSEPMFEVPGGDYDAHNFGEREDLERLFINRGTCSGATDCERVVREEIRRGAGVIKLRLAGINLMDPKSGPMETPAEMPPSSTRHTGSIAESPRIPQAPKPPIKWPSKQEPTRSNTGPSLT